MSICASAVLSEDPDTITPGIWVMPKLWPSCSPGPERPPPGSTCSSCGCSSWWTEKPPSRAWGWRCRCCGSQPTRPEDRIETTGAAE
jgi:hypothetical protein